MARGRLTSLVLGTALAPSLMLNLWMLNSSIDVGITLDHTEVALRATLNERNVAIAACNAALDGSQKDTVLSSVEAIGATVMEETEQSSSPDIRQEIFADNVRLDFLGNKLVGLSTPFD